MLQRIAKYFLLVYCVVCCLPTLEAKVGLRLVQEWAELEFVFPSEEAKNTALEKKHYLPGKSVPVDIDVHHREGQESRLFVTIPRFSEGRPVTLGTVESDGKIKAYPDYSWQDNQGHNCDGITSVFRTMIDDYNRLWVMDTGKIGRKIHCKPQLYAFDLTTDRMLYRHVLEESAYTALSLYITPVVDVRPNGNGECDDTFVYVADPVDHGILVVDVLHDKSWRVTHRYFYPYPSYGIVTIDGTRFNIMDGVFGMALSPFKHGRDRKLYFHSLAAVTENVVSTALLRNTSYIHNGYLDIDAVIEFPQERTSQSAAEAMDSQGIMYFGMMEPPSIWCWNTATEFSPQNFHSVAIDHEALQFACGVKVVKNSNGEEELWVMTSSFQRVATGTLKTDIPNFRIHTEKISKLMQNSPCSRNNQRRLPSIASRFRPHNTGFGLDRPIFLKKGHLIYAIDPMDIEDF